MESTSKIPLRYHTSEMFYEEDGTLVEEPEESLEQLENDQRQSPNYYTSKAGKAIRNHDELALLTMLKSKWREEGLNYTEVSNFLKDYFNLTEDISREELHLYGWAVKEINQIEKTELSDKRKKILFLKSDVPFMGWAEMWYEPTLYKISMNKLEENGIEPTEDDLRRLAYRCGQNYDEMKAHETPGRYMNEQGFVWNSVRDAILEIAGRNAHYTFWDD